MRGLVYVFCVSQDLFCLYTYKSNICNYYNNAYMLHAIYTNGAQKKSKDFIDPIPRQFQDVEVKAVTCTRWSSE